MCYVSLNLVKTLPFVTAKITMSFHEHLLLGYIQFHIVATPLIFFRRSLVTQYKLRHCASVNCGSIVNAQGEAPIKKKSSLPGLMEYVAPRMVTKEKVISPFLFLLFSICAPFARFAVNGAVAKF